MNHRSLLKWVLFAFFSLYTLSSVATAGPSVRMAYLQNDIHHLAFWVALEKEYFKAEGVTVEIVGAFKAGPEIMSGFAAKSLDMAYVGEAPATTAVANKMADIVVVAQVNTEGSALVISKKESSIRKLSDLSGKTVAVPGHSTVQDFLLRKALTKSGVNIGDVNIIVIKPPEMIGALRTKQIDAFIAWEPYPSQAFMLEVGRNLATSKEMWENHPCCVLVTDKKYAKAHPDIVEAVVRAHIRATAFIKDFPVEAVNIGVKYTGMDADTVQLAMKTVNYTHDLSVEGEMEYVRFLSELKYIRLENPDEFVDEFINPQFLEKITHP